MWAGNGQWSSFYDIQIYDISIKGSEILHNIYAKIWIGMFFVTMFTVPHCLTVCPCFSAALEKLLVLWRGYCCATDHTESTTRRRSCANQKRTSPQWSTNHSAQQLFTPIQQLPSLLHFQNPFYIVHLDFTTNPFCLLSLSSLSFFPVCLWP